MTPMLKDFIAFPMIREIHAIKTSDQIANKKEINNVSIKKLYNVLLLTMSIAFMIRDSIVIQQILIGVILKQLIFYTVTLKISSIANSLNCLDGILL